MLIQELDLMYIKKDLLGEQRKSISARKRTYTFVREHMNENIFRSRLARFKIDGQIRSDRTKRSASGIPCYPTCRWASEPEPRDSRESERGLSVNGDRVVF